eukprot:Ihof_evm3s207 gene=Ihof_evmTU3s207
MSVDLTLDLTYTLALASYYVYEVENDVDKCRAPPGYTCFKVCAMGREEWNFTAAAFIRNLIPTKNTIVSQVDTEYDSTSFIPATPYPSSTNTTSPFLRKTSKGTSDTLQHTSHVKNTKQPQQEQEKENTVESNTPLTPPVPSTYLVPTKKETSDTLQHTKQPHLKQANNNIGASSAPIIIAFRGTCTQHDLLADLMVAFGRRPHTLRFALAFINSVLQEYTSLPTVYLTGHSLGAILAEVVGCELGYNAVTFESPGSLPLVMGCTREREGEGVHTYISPSHNIITFLTRPNLVNTCHSHAGRVYRVVIPLRGNHGNYVRPSFWHLVKCLLSTLGRIATVVYPLKVMAEAYWALKEAHRTAAVAVLTKKEVIAAKEVYRVARHKAFMSGILSSLGLFKFERNHRRYVGEAKIGREVAKAAISVATIAHNTAEGALMTLLHSRALMALLPYLLAYRSFVTFAASTLDDVFRTRRGGQHSMSMIVDALNQPNPNILPMTTWPGKAGRTIWSLYKVCLSILPL